MENAEEILQCLDEFSKVKPKDIPRELEEYLCFVAKTGDPIYQWPLIKCLFREKLINVITEFYETCPSVEIPPCPNVDTFNYDNMKSFILEKLDTFAAAPFTVQRICELLTAPRKEYNRIDKYMRALEKNILVVSTREPGNRRNTENGESVVNGLESEHVTQDNIINSEINVEVEMDDASVWPKTTYVQEQPIIEESQKIQDTFISETKTEAAACSSTIETVITSRPINYMYPQTTPKTITETTEPLTETAVLPNPADNITVTIANVTEEEIDQLAEEEGETPSEEPPIYVSPLNTKDTSIYIGTNENGDQLYRIKYEPYVEIDYMAIPETAFPSEPENVYEGEVKPETSESPQVIAVSETIQPDTIQPDSVQPESIQSETIQSENIQPESTTEPEKPNWEVSNSTETIPTSSDDITPKSETKNISDDQVTESNISDDTVTQTEIKEPEPIIQIEQEPENDVTESVEEKMESSGDGEPEIQIEQPQESDQSIKSPTPEITESIEKIEADPLAQEPVLETEITSDTPVVPDKVPDTQVTDDQPSETQPVSETEVVSEAPVVSEPTEMSVPETTQEPEKIEEPVVSMEVDEPQNVVSESDNLQEPSTDMITDDTN